MIPGFAGGGPWVLERTDGHILTPYLTLLPDGRIGGTPRRSESTWSLHHGCLHFRDGLGRISISFPLSDAGAGCLTGTSARHGAVRLHPTDGHAATLPASRHHRRNLVLLRAGKGSLHPFWTRDLPDEERSWDLCLSWYGDAPSRPDGCDYFCPAPGTKFEGLTDFFKTETLAWDYDFVWMPDDDLMIGWADINRLFALCAEYDLMLAQPSLEKTCFINHPITGQSDAFVLRFSSFVEIMAPVFSRAALRLCAPSFAASRSGYGLDHLWPRLIGAPPTRIAIVDAVSVVHTRPIGASYDLAAAIAEGNRIEDEYALMRRYQIFGYVPVEPHGFVRLRDRTTNQPIFLTGEAAKVRCA